MELKTVYFRATITGKKVEGEIERTLEEDGFFISSHSDLAPKGLPHLEVLYSRPSHPGLVDRLRLHGKKHAFERWGNLLPLGN